MPRRFAPRNDGKADLTWITRTYRAAGRIGTDEDMAGAAIYLASRAGDYVIGKTITVDGGLVHAALGTSIDA